jgi:hypothetical protein
VYAIEEVLMSKAVFVHASIGFVGLATLFGSTVSATTRSDAEVKESVARARVPFVENQGQIPDPSVAYHAETFAAACVVEKSGAVSYFGGTETDGFAIRERFNNEALSPEGIEPSKVKVSSFRGRDPEGWRSDLPAFNTISLGEISDGVSLVLQAHNNNVEKIFTVAPGADPSAISVRVEGVGSLRVSTNGELELGTKSGPFTFSAPIAYQEIGGGRTEVKVAYDLRSDTQYGFVVADYDRERPLVIDPIIASTYIGRNSTDFGAAVVADSDGNIYVAGRSKDYSSWNSAYQTTAGSYSATALGGVDIYFGSTDVVVSKFDPTLGQLLASTFVGGASGDSGTAMEIEIGAGPGGSDRIVVAGLTGSDDFPTTSGAFDEEHNGSADVFVFRLNDDLSTLLASTYVGGSNLESHFETNMSRGPDLAMDTAGNIYVAGTTASSDFPHIPAGKELVGYTPFRAGKNSDDDAFVIKLSNNLENLLGWTYLGGDKQDRGTAVGVDNAGHVFVAGHTTSGEDWLPPPYDQFPITPGAFDTTHNSLLEDGFVSRFNSDLTVLEASTFIGGDYEDYVWDLAVAQDGSAVYIVGRTGSSDFPTPPTAFMPAKFASKNGFVSKLNSGLTGLVAGTYLGGIPTDMYPTSSTETCLYGVALDDFGTVWVTGYSNDDYQPTFPVTIDLDDPGLKPWYDPAYYKYEDVILTGFPRDLRRLHTSLHVSGADDQVAWAIFPRSVRPAPPEEDYVEVTVAGWSESGTSSDRFYPVFLSEPGFVDSFDSRADNDDLFVTTFRIDMGPFFADGFESGTTEEWSSTVP